MRLNTQDYARKVQFPLLLALATAPIAPLLCSILDVRLRWIAWLFPMAFVAMGALGLVVPGGMRFVVALMSIACLMGGGVAAMYYFQVSNLLLLIVPVVYSALLLWTLRIAGWSWNEELSEIWFLFGMFCHAISQIILEIIEIREETEWTLYRTLLLTCFFGFVLLVMLSMNRDSMIAATSGRYRASASMRMKNTVLTVAFFVVALVLYLAPMVVEILETMLFGAVGLLMIVSDIIFATKETKADTSNEIVEEVISRLPIDIGSVSQRDTFHNPTMDLVEHILIIVLATVGILLVIWLLIRLLKGGYRLLIYLTDYMNRYATDVAEDYEDTVTDTREPDGKGNVRRRRLGRRLARVDESKMTPGERIRHRYMRLLMKHPEWSQDSTARENLSAEIAPIYERARYSRHPVSENDAERFAKQINAF